MTGRSMKRIPEQHLQIHFFKRIQDAYFGGMRSQTWTLEGGNTRNQVLTKFQWLRIQVSASITYPKSDISKKQMSVYFPKHCVTHFRQHNTLLTLGVKKPPGLFPAHSVSRGIPSYPSELENTLALNSTRSEKELRPGAWQRANPWIQIAAG